MIDAMKSIAVAAAIIERDGRILVCQRGYGEQKGKWEFPGGKIEKGESGEDALSRELCEELEMSVSIDRLFRRIEYDYPTFHISLYCYHCTLKREEFTLKEHLAARWVARDELESVDWLGADHLVVPALKEYLR